MPDVLNDTCHCISLDEAALVRHFDAALVREGGLPQLLVGREHLFAPYPVFANQAQWDAMQSVIGAAHEVMALPAFQAEALAAGDWPEQHTLSAMMAFDFHPEPAGAKLIEINTNAGGAFLNAALGQAQRACCPEVRDWVTTPADMQRVGAELVEMFRDEWQLARGQAPLRRIAIVDTQPAAQYLYPEFLLAQRLFEAHDMAAVIADPSRFTLVDGRLECDGAVVDLVYNRLTDFYFDSPEHAVLRNAYATDAAVFTPHPRAHALYANKHNLALLADAERLRDWGIDEATIAVLIAGIPRTIRVRAEDADALWSERKHWFFKPAGGFGSRGAYRGDKLTKKVFAEILASDYVAQAIALPGERHLGPAQPLKIDLRNYVYDGQIQLVAARLYQGQTTNFRTPGGGFAPVYHPPTDTPT